MPGFAVDRMCAGALTAMTAGAGEIAMGAADVVIAGGVEHMGHHPMGEDVDFNPRFVAERLVDTSAVDDGRDRREPPRSLPAPRQGGCGPVRGRVAARATAAWGNGVMRDTVVPMAVFSEDGWKVADRDEFLRPETTLEGLATCGRPSAPAAA